MMAGDEAQGQEWQSQIPKLVSASLPFQILKNKYQWINVGSIYSLSNMKYL